MTRAARVSNFGVFVIFQFRHSWDHEWSNSKHFITTDDQTMKPRTKKPRKTRARTRDKKDHSENSEENVHGSLENSSGEEDGDGPKKTSTDDGGGEMGDATL